ncbi:MAG: hypothetical protein AAGF94_12025 [Pseudomonadota bacterium]
MSLRTVLTTVVVVVAVGFAVYLAANLTTIPVDDLPAADLPSDNADTPADDFLDPTAPSG